MQSVLPIIMALTFPAARTAIGTTPSGFAGVLHRSNRLHVLTPLAIIFSVGVANLTLIEPATTKTMRQRKSQEVKDGKKSYDPAPHSEDMQALNKKFAYLHGASSLVNVFGCLATVWYGFYLADRIV